MPTPDNKKELSKCCGAEKYKRFGYEDNPETVCSACNKPFIPQSTEEKKCELGVIGCKGKYFHNHSDEECKNCKGQTQKDCRCSWCQGAMQSSTSPDPFTSRTLAEFDEIWRMWSNDTSLLNYEKIKDFLSSALNAQRENIREQVEKLVEFQKEKYKGGLCSHVDEVLKILSPNNKENGNRN